MMTYLGYDDNFHQSWTMMGNTLSLESNNHDDQKLDSLSCSLFLHHTFSLPCSSRLWRFLKYDVGMLIWEHVCCVSKKSPYTNFYLSCQAAEVRVHGVLHMICNHSLEPRD